MNLSVLEGAEAIKTVTPGIASSFEQGLWLPDIAQMRNPRLIKAAKGSLDYYGVKYHENTSVEKLKISDAKISGVIANGKTYHAEQVLIAGGAWSGEILRQFHQPPNIEPVKGQMILFEPAADLLKNMLLVDNRYLIPRKDGRILCGSSIEHTGFDKTTSADIKQDLLNSASEIFPALAKLKIEHHWAGLRPGSPHGVPYIGRHNEVEGLYINAGHFRNGVILGIGSCQKVAGEIIRHA